MLYEQSEYYELIKKHFPVSKYHLDLEIVKNPPQDYINDFFEKLSNHERFEELKNDFVYDKELDVFIHIHNRFLNSEISDLSREEVFFYPFMDKKEIKQIFKIESASDYLLRLRAEQVENDMRLKRTFSKLKKRIGDKWSFTNYFESTQFRKYLKYLKQERKRFCTNIPHGTIHSNEANGMCFQTPFGNIIVLSYALRHFLFYMNVFHFGSQLGIKEEDSFYSFLLAVRIMMGKESLDFELDTRGKLPKSIKRQIDFLTDWQMSFIIGHEYAHHYLGHLETKSILKSHTKVLAIGDKIQHYTHRHKCEFEADLHSIIESTFSPADKIEHIDGAFMFFTYLSMFDKVENYLSPRIGYSSTHPEPIDRIWKLRESVTENIGLTKTQLQSIIDSSNSFMDTFIKDFLPYNVEKIEMTGSVYLPSYKKKILVDRLDF